MTRCRTVFGRNEGWTILCKKYSHIVRKGRLYSEVVESYGWGERSYGARDNHSKCNRELCGGYDEGNDDG